MERQMKDSGIEWIGEIPETWRIRKGKWILEHLERPVLPDDGVITCFRDGEVTLRSNRREDGFTFSLQEAGYQGIEPGDLVVHGMDGFAGAIGISDSRGKGTPVLNVLDSTEDKKYLTYFLRTMAHNGIFLALSTGIRVRSCDTNWNKLKELQYVLPSSDEQERIVAFLDRKCAEIDAVIECTKATIEEYKKLKQAVITEAVTKGVRGPRPMKDSGIEWIGEIPEGWTTAILKYSVRWKSEKGQPDATVLSLYRDYGVVPKDSRDDNHNVTSLDTSTYKVVAVGDFVINKMKAWQGSMAVSDYAGIVSPAYHVCEITNPMLNKRYLHHLLRNHLYIPEYTRLSTGMRIGQWDLGFDDFKNLPFIIPPVDEQAEIVEYIENGLSQYDTLIAKKTALLTELETYKKSLIYEYITGKKEVTA